MEGLRDYGAEVTKWVQLFHSL